ncbi:YqjK-like family protein [Chromatiaceae bacterium AAb-1]|nr:YqjK-like family protein [Chromatiaceae bacterium AAb-1]
MVHRYRAIQHRKAQLIRQIRQQRTELAAYTDEWHQVTDPLDQGWQNLLKYKMYILAAASLLAINTISHPDRLLRWSKRALSLWSSYTLLRRLSARMRP